MATSLIAEAADWPLRQPIRRLTVHYERSTNSTGGDDRNQNVVFHIPRRSQTLPTQRHSNTPSRIVCKRGNRYTSDSNQNSPWSGKNVLSLDGGGVKGYASLLILQKLMQYIEQEEKKRIAFATSSGAYPWGDAITEQPELHHAQIRADPSISIPSSAAINNACSPGTYLPCHYFDYIAGTSAGGLSAIMLSRLRMSVQEALDQYESIGNDIFGKPRIFHMRSWKTPAPRHKYRTQNVKKAIEKVIVHKLSHQGNLDEHEAKRARFESNQGKCRTIIASHLRERSTANTHLFRSYNHYEHQQNRSPRDPGPASQDEISKVALATIAAPFYFEPVKQGNKTFTDGGLRANNPAYHALEDIRILHGQNPSLMLSIGTGKKQAKTSKSRPRIFPCMRTSSDKSYDSNRKSRFPWFGYLKEAFYGTIINMKDGVTDVEGTADHVRTLCLAGNISHYRWNPDPGFPGIKLDSWEPAKTGHNTLKFLREKTQEYLDLPEVDRELRECAQKLVECRQARAETIRWEEFAGDYRYYCHEQGCRTAHADMMTSFATRDEFKDHLLSDHPIVQRRFTRVVIDNHTEQRLTCTREEGEEIRSFANEQALQSHLRQAHGVLGEISILSPMELEDKLDKGRLQECTPVSSRGSTPV